MLENIQELEVIDNKIFFDGKWRTIYFDSKGYKNIWHDGKNKKLHRVIYAYHHGEILENHDIHHIDGNKINNSIENLEMIHHNDHISQRHNRGFTYYNKCKKYWVASKSVNKKVKELGRFETEQEAKDCLEEFNRSGYIPPIKTRYNGTGSITFDKRIKKYNARGASPRRKYVGVFETKEEAEIALKNYLCQNERNCQKA